MIDFAKGRLLFPVVEELTVVNVTLFIDGKQVEK